MGGVGPKGTVFPVMKNKYFLESHYKRNRKYIKMRSGGALFYEICQY